MFGIVIQRLALQLILDIVLFPVWWYTDGLRRVVIALWYGLQDANQTVAPGLWLRNIFTPMYGQRDIQGRLLSVFVRFINVIIRSIVLGVWMVCLLALLIIWIVLPICICVMIVRVYTLQ